VAERQARTGVRCDHRCRSWLCKIRIAGKKISGSWPIKHVSNEVVEGAALLLLLLYHDWWWW
jgi:hypothetical protein